MMVWLHTASPPQHIANLGEVELMRELGGVATYLASTNVRRGLKCEFAGVFEDDHGETSVHIFDRLDRAEPWMHRNADRYDLLIASDGR